MVVNAGNSLILDCLATGNPLPVITWLKDGVSSGGINFEDVFPSFFSITKNHSM